MDLDMLKPLIIQADSTDYTDVQSRKLFGII